MPAMIPAHAVPWPNRSPPMGSATTWASPPFSSTAQLSLSLPRTDGWSASTPESTIATLTPSPVAPPKAHSRSIVSRAGRRVRPLRVSGLKGSDQAGSSSTAGIGLSAEATAPTVGPVLGDDAQDVANQVKLALAPVAEPADLVDQRADRHRLVDVKLA